MTSEMKSPRQKKYVGYRTAYIAWHESISDDFDLISTLKALAEANGLVVTEKVGKSSHRLRIDTRESDQMRRRRRPAVDHALQQEATRLLRRALRDPQAAERIKTLVERARRGENVGPNVPDAMDQPAS